MTSIKHTIMWSSCYIKIIIVCDSAANSFFLPAWFLMLDFLACLLDWFYIYTYFALTLSIPLLHADTRQSGWKGWCRACWTWRQTHCTGRAWRWCWGRVRWGWCPCRRRSSPWSTMPSGRCRAKGNAARLKEREWTSAIGRLSQKP